MAKFRYFRRLKANEPCISKTGKLPSSITENLVQYTWTVYDACHQMCCEICNILEIAMKWCYIQWVGTLLYREKFQW